MRLTQLSAHGFRNLSPDPIFFGSGVTLIVGENAQGKTNLLEAVALVCGQRSFRRGRPAQMAADGQSFSIQACLERGPQRETLRVEWSRAERRRFERDGKPISFREASARAPAVFLAPDHRDLIAGSPAARRRFLDRLALASRPASGADLMRYERALASRNVLLARARDVESPAEELEAWTEELVCAGTAVRLHRRRALEQWREAFEELAREAGKEYAEIQVDYLAAEQSQEELRAAYQRLARVERRRGHTLCGPHRDDLAWTRAGRALAGEASAGEIHRAVALAKLAEWRAVARATGERPLLAIDEFDAGLAAGWVEALTATLPQAETILLTTASEPGRFAHRVDHVLEIRAGRALGRPRAVNA